MRNIEQALLEHKQAVLAAGFKEENLLGIFLYGSQNYGTETEDSDVDTKAIIIPTFEELVFNRPVSKELTLPNNEHCEVKDIREIVNNFRKQNINFIEILYTDYFWLNPKFEDIWYNFFIDIKENISHYDIQKCVQSISHQALHTIKQDRNNPKKISNARRLQLFLDLYSCGFQYIDCLVPVGHDKLVIMELKKGIYKYSDETIDNMIKHFEDFTKTELKISEKVQNEIDKHMNDGIITLIKRNLN